MEKIIFFGLVIPILGFVLYLGATAIMKGLVLKVLIKSVRTMKMRKLMIFQMMEINLAMKLKD